MTWTCLGDTRSCRENIEKSDVSMAQFSVSPRGDFPVRLRSLGYSGSQPREILKAPTAAGTLTGTSSAGINPTHCRFYEDQTTHSLETLTDELSFAMIGGRAQSAML